MELSRVILFFIAYCNKQFMFIDIFDIFIYFFGHTDTCCRHLYWPA